tara:strand:+ start:3230 stop:4438 length:1209 start_codon:yes stop_codon:yes gene_type:complete
MVFRLIILIFLFTTSSFSNVRPFVSFDLDSGAFVKPYTNSSVASLTLFSHDFINMASWSANRNLLYLNRKLGFYLRAFMTGLIMNNTYFSFYFLPYKEFGHGSRGRAFGVEPEYYLVGSDDVISKTYYDFFGQVLSGLAGSEGFSTSIKKPDSSEWSVHSLVNSEDLDLIWYAGGVNNLVFFSESIDNRFYERGMTSVYDMTGFFMSKMAISNLGQAEINPIRSRYIEKGIDMSYGDFKRYNGYSVLTSLTFWAFVEGWSRYLVSGIDHIQYNEVYNIRLPNVSMYLTSHGPSYRVQSGYRFSANTHIPVAVEYVFKGEKQAEFTLGFSKRWFRLLKSYSEIRLGEGVGLTQSIGIRAPYFSSIGVGFDYCNFKNLYGERHISSLKNGNADVNFWVSYSYRK